MIRCSSASAEREDLIGASMLGLIEAADRYDGSREEPFISFAEHRIRGVVLDELRCGDIMPRRLRQLARKIAAAIRVLEKDGEVATDQRIADALATLVPRDVTILGLHHLEDMTFQEIAELLRVTPSRVCQLLWRAIERVRMQLGAKVAAA